MLKSLNDDHVEDLTRRVLTYADRFKMEAAIGFAAVEKMMRSPVHVGVVSDELLRLSMKPIQGFDGFVIDLAVFVASRGHFNAPTMGGLLKADHLTRVRFADLISAIVCDDDAAAMEWASGLDVLPVDAVVS